MAKGFQKDRERKAALSALGHPLSRRARSRCELCETSGRPLTPVEVEPLPDAPEVDRALMLCDRCRDAARGGRLGEPGEWRFLEGVVWSELPAVQVTAVRLLRRLSGEGVDWTRDTLDGLYLEEDVTIWIDAAT
jgi:protein PhnA